MLAKHLRQLFIKSEIPCKLNSKFDYFIVLNLMD